MNNTAHNKCTESSRLTAILFGKTGVGKSSVINMLLPDHCPDRDKADVSSSAHVATERSQGYDMKIKDTSITLYDTAGLGGISPCNTARAAGMLYTLIYNRGISFLIFVVRASGNNIDDLNSARTYYKIVHDIFCGGKVPVLLLVTGMEDKSEEESKEWWRRNEEVLRRQNLFFEGQACITAKLGKNNGDKPIYDRSKKAMEDAITEFCKLHCTTWRPPVIEETQLRSVLAQMFEQTFVHSPLLYKGIKLAEEKKQEAKKLANAIWEDMQKDVSVGASSNLY